MNSLKILHCADIHIGAAESFLGSAAVSRRYETLITFEKIIDTAKENGVQLIAIAGDLFDSNKTEPEFIEPVFRKISEIPDIKVIFAAGNHDPLNSESPFKKSELPENLYVLDTSDQCITFDDIKTRVYGKSFESTRLHGEECFSIVPPKDDYIKLLVLHGDLTSDLTSDYNSITPKFVKSCKMDYIALGHVHKRTPVGRIDDTFFAYSGCPEGQGFDELDSKGIYIGEIGKGKCNLEFVDISKRKHIYEKIDITDALTTPAICERIIAVLKEKHQDYAQNLYKLELIGMMPQDTVINISEIVSRISDEVYFVKIKDKTEFEIDAEKLSEEISLKGIFVKNMLVKMENAAPDEKEKLKRALNLGLKAFNSEVAFNED